MSAHAVDLAARVPLSATAVRPRSVALCGFGTVGQSVARILCSGRHPELRLTHILNRNVSRRRADWVPRSVAWLEDIEDVFASGADVLVEVIGGREPARSWIRRALESGRSVVTANKQVVAEFGPELFQAARRMQQALGFEAAVAGGVPVIQAIGAGLAGDELVSVAGVLNGTSNYILSRMEETGARFEAALDEARTLGYAEADPSADVDGLDARAKLAILSMVALGTRLTPDHIAARTIRGIGPVDFAHARRCGGTIRQIAAVAPSPHHDGCVTARVGPAIVPSHSPFARATGSTNVVVVRGLFGGDTVYSGFGAGGDPTAVAIVSDLLAIARGSGSRVPSAFSVPRRVRDAVCAPHYVRVRLRDAQRRRCVLDMLAGGDRRVTVLEAGAGASSAADELACIVETCSSTLVEAAIAGCSEHLTVGAPVICLPLLFKDDE